MIYRFAGENIECSLDLPLTHAENAASPDVVVTVEEADTLPAAQPIDVMLHEGILSGMHWKFGTVDGGAGWAFEFGEAASGAISNDRSAIHVFALRSVPKEWIAEAVTGWALVYRLAVGGQATFHGSAVTLDGESAVAILGPTGSGKSTLAAASLAIGGAMIADDVLAPRVALSRVDDRDVESYVLDTTGAAVKLRGAAQKLAERFADAGDTATTFDNRHQVRAATHDGPIQLDRIYFLDPAQPDGIVRIDPIQVAIRLCGNAKVGFWSSTNELGNDFEAACELAERVPGFTIGRPAEPSSATPEHLVAIARSLFA